MRLVAAISDAQRDYDERNISRLLAVFPKLQKEYIISTIFLPAREFVSYSDIRNFLKFIITLCQSI